MVPLAEEVIKSANKTFTFSDNYLVFFIAVQFSLVHFT